MRYTNQRQQFQPVPARLTRIVTQVGHTYVDNALIVSFAVMRFERLKHNPRSRSRQVNRTLANRPAPLDQVNIVSSHLNLQLSPGYFTATSSVIY